MSNVIELNCQETASTAIDGRKGRTLAVIPTFNGRSRIAETLDRLAELLVPAHLQLEICVVENLSHDGTAALVEAWAQQHPAVSVQYMHQPTPGKMNALQMAVDSTDAEWVIMLDDDVSVESNWLLAAFSAMVGRRRVGFCAGPIALGESRDLPAWVRPLLSYFAIYDFGPVTLELIDRQLAGAGVLVRREAWQQSVPGICRLLGRTQGSLVGGEDIESQRCMQRHGWIGLYVPEMRLIHRVDRARFAPETLARQTFSVGLEKCFSRMAARSGAAAWFVIPASVLYDWPLGLIGLLTGLSTETHIYERNRILGQMLSPAYFVLHRFKARFKRVQTSAVSRRRAL